jgi:hypothetical protein
VHDADAAWIVGREWHHLGVRSILAQECEFIKKRFLFPNAMARKKPRRCHARFQRLAPDPIFGSERRRSA